MGVGTTAWATTGYFATLSPVEHQKAVGPRQGRSPSPRVVDNYMPTHLEIHRHVLRQASYERNAARTAAREAQELKDYAIEKHLCELAIETCEENYKKRHPERQQQAAGKPLGQPNGVFITIELS